MAQSAHIIDMDTAEGCFEWLDALPTANLEAIAAQEVFYGPVSNLLLVATAEGILILRRNGAA